MGTMAGYASQSLHEITYLLCQSLGLIDRYIPLYCFSYRKTFNRYMQICTCADAFSSIVWTHFDWNTVVSPHFICVTMLLLSTC